MYARVRFNERFVSDLLPAIAPFHSRASRTQIAAAGIIVSRAIKFAFPFASPKATPCNSALNSLSQNPPSPRVRAGAPVTKKSSA